ncbi:hypothetical protein SDJN03_28685, partial [Cucurbita argyrosperma subsp. sororia]
MAKISAFASLSIFNLLLFSSFSALALDIGIGIGIGGGSNSPPPSTSPDCNTSPPPPPSPPPPRPPSPPPPLPSKPAPATSPKRRSPKRSPAKLPTLRFESKRIKIAYRVIQNYKSRIENDPLNVTGTWNGTDVCSYKGFRCDKYPDAENKRAVSGLSFNNFNFSGSKLTLDGLADKLSDIAYFHANSNFFFGTIPKLIAMVKFLYELDLSNNKFKGSFPNEVLGAVNLTFLDLRFNYYCGPVNPRLFDMDIIAAIFLNNNKFNQSIPANLGNTPARYLTFTSNEFTGEIPKSIGTGKTRKTLIEVLFSDNKLSGCLPMEIGQLENTILFDASKNTLTGPIPYSFACLAKMEVLNFANNRLYGAVPEAVCKLPSLQNFTLYNNFLTQVGPVCRSLIGRKILDVSGNCILGLPGQRSEKECSYFFSKVHSCSDEKSMKYIPCTANKYLYGDPTAGPLPPPRKMTEMRTYAALVPN